MDSRKRSGSAHGPSRFKNNKRKRGGRGKQGSGHRPPAEQEGSKRDQIEHARQRRKDRGDQEKPAYAVEFSKEEIEQEDRKPKKKVAVLIGYSGTGYKGMQLSDNQRTIEGDLFKALVAAGAVSKANADDPKKSALIRCARTDKGVHAAGNVVSMKLTVQDEDIVEKINSHLSSQIRVWGYEVVPGSFSAYREVDSRIYEYLVPTHCFVPPHPETFLAKQLVELASEAGDFEAYQERQEDAASFWSEAEETYLRPVLDRLEPEIRDEALKAIFEIGINQALRGKNQGKAMALLEEEGDTRDGDESTQNSDPSMARSEVEPTKNQNSDIPLPEPAFADTGQSKDVKVGTEDAPSTERSSKEHEMDSNQQPSRPMSPLESAIRTIRAAQLRAKLAYRITPSRLERVKSTLSRYVGTNNYHNYTIQKQPTDPSAKRHIKSFVVAGEPFLINNTEWLSLKVHGQSFMMHQIRKMVFMAAFIVRCGCHEGRIQDSFGEQRMIVPRAPSLGLLLERPLFDAYNRTARLSGNVDREKIDFDKYKATIEEFKQREIYQRIWREEEQGTVFYQLFSAMDALRTGQLLYLSSKGLEAMERKIEGDVNDWGYGSMNIKAEAEVEGVEEEGDEDGNG